MIQTLKYKFIIYSSSDFKTQIEKTGAEFRPLKTAIQRNQQEEDHQIPTFATDLRKIELNIKPNHRVSRQALFVSELVDIAESNALYLAKEIYNENPNLILYENIGLHATLALRVLEENYQLVKSGCHEKHRFKVIYYSTSFLQENNVYPNESEVKLSNEFKVDELIKIEIDREFVVTRAKSLSKYFCINYIDPFDETFNADSRILNLVLVLPELHPRVYLYHRNNKFIGTIINEAEEVSSSTCCLKSIFQEIQASINTDKRTHLIFVCLNSKFEENLQIYLKLLDSFNYLSSFKFKIIISFDKKGLADFEKLLKDYNIKLNEDVFVLENLNCFEILKYSSLFITNCELYRVNLTLFNGVPMLCLPISSNQMLISHRISTELGLGIFIDFTCFDRNDFLQAVDNLINNYFYKKNCLEFSRHFIEYDAKYTATSIVQEFVNTSS